MQTLSASVQNCAAAIVQDVNQQPVERALMHFAAAASHLQAETSGLPRAREPSVDIFSYQTNGAGQIAPVHNSAEAAGIVNDPRLV